MIVFKTPIFLIVAVALPFAVGYWLRERKEPALRFSSVDLLPKGHLKQGKVRWIKVPRYMRILALALLCVAMAGPRSVSEHAIYNTEGIDIVLALDISGSMAAEDFSWEGKRVNRLDIVKRVVGEFIKERANDRIGLVAFSREAYTVSPLTTDHDWLMQNLERLRLGVSEDGTAIGSGLRSALLRLRNSEARSKVVVLLTDGMNNAGKIDPRQAAEVAKGLEVKIYTVGAGSRGLVPFPVQDMWGRKVYQKVQIDLDEGLLQGIADQTGGRYFRATDTDSLRKVYQEIDLLEKVEMEQYGYRQYKELFVYCVYAALFLIGLEVILKNTFFLKLP